MSAARPLCTNRIETEAQDAEFIGQAIFPLRHLPIFHVARVQVQSENSNKSYQEYLRFIDRASNIPNFRSYDLIPHNHH
jgi:hypothetical protein